MAFYVSGNSCVLLEQICLLYTEVLTNSVKVEQQPNMVPSCPKAAGDF